MAENLSRVCLLLANFDSLLSEHSGSFTLFLNLKLGFLIIDFIAASSESIITTARVSITEGFDVSEDILTVRPQMVLEMIVNGSITLDASTGINITQLPVDSGSSMQDIRGFVSSVLDTSSLEIGPHVVDYNAQVCKTLIHSIPDHYIQLEGLTMVPRAYSCMLSFCRDFLL